MLHSKQGVGESFCVTSILYPMVLLMALSMGVLCVLLTWMKRFIDWRLIKQYQDATQNRSEYRHGIIIILHRIIIIAEHGDFEWP